MPVIPTLDEVTETIDIAVITEIVREKRSGKLLLPS